MNNRHNYMKIKDTVNSSLKDEKVENLMQYCKEKNVLFVDKEFPPAKQSLIGNPQAKDYKGEWNDINWSKASDIFGDDYELFRGIEPSDIRQGSLGDCYFLCSLASLAEYPDLITRLFDFNQITENGIQVVWLNINGVWTRYILDEYFPTVQKRAGPQLAFSKTDQNELWVLLLEKAYAKAYGSYWEIVGGDPVHALRDLTGAPYSRIEDFQDLDAAWAKLKEANAKQFMMTCFTHSSEKTEEKSDQGMVSGHAYTILDVRNVIDSRGRPRRILQIRNPWGKFEWQGDFSDNSNSWSNEDRKNLNVHNSDDGIFWMSLEDFSKHFQGVGILEIIPGAVHNGMSIQKNISGSNLTLARMTVSKNTNLNLSLNQIDSRTVDNPAYSYSYFRITIGKIAKDNNIEFVDSILSCERNIFLENTLEVGDYIVLVEAYWENDLIRNYNLSTYSDNRVELQLLEDNDKIYLKSEYLIWKDFGLKNKNKMELKKERYATDGQNKAMIKNYQYQNQHFGMMLYNYVNEDNKNSVHSVIKFDKLQGFDPNGASLNNRGAELIINPNDNDVILYKMDPREKSFSLANQIVQEEVIPYKFSDDTKTVEKLNNLGGKQPTPNNNTPEITSRLTQQQKILEEQQKNYQKDQFRQQQMEQRQNLIEENKKKMMEDMMRQQNQLKDNGMMNLIPGGMAMFSNFFGGSNFQASPFGGMNRSKPSLFGDLVNFGMGMFTGKQGNPMGNLMNNQMGNMMSNQMGNMMSNQMGNMMSNQLSQQTGNLMKNQMGQQMGNLGGINNLLSLGNQGQDKGLNNMIMDYGSKEVMNNLMGNKKTFGFF
jgi:calpain-15